MYVTDTHSLIWYIAKKYKKLSGRVKNIFDDAVIHQSCALIVPAAVLWEISLKQKADAKSIVLAVSYTQFLERLFAIPTILEEPVTRSIVARSHELNFPNDPFDTLIVATALEKDLPLITNDARIHNAQPCELIWD